MFTRLKLKLNPLSLINGWKVEFDLFELVLIIRVVADLLDSL